MLFRTHTHTHTYSLSLSLCLARFFSHFLSRHTHIQTLSHTHTCTRTFTHTLIAFQSLSLPHTHTHTLIHTHTHAHTYSHTLCWPFSHFVFLSHIHSFSLSLSLSLAHTCTRIFKHALIAVESLCFSFSHTNTRTLSHTHIPAHVYAHRLWLPFKHCMFLYRHTSLMHRLYVLTYIFDAPSFCTHLHRWCTVLLYSLISQSFCILLYNCRSITVSAYIHLCLWFTIFLYSIIFHQRNACTLHSCIRFSCMHALLTYKL